MTGNRSKPFATVPSYMRVAVASKVPESESTVSGAIAPLVVIKTHDGYAPDPGVAGTGTLVGPTARCPDAQEVNVGPLVSFLGGET